MYGSSRSQFFRYVFPALVIITVITDSYKETDSRSLLPVYPPARYYHRFLPEKNTSAVTCRQGFKVRANAFQIIIFIGRSVGRKTFARFLVSDDNLRFPGSKTTRATKPCPHCGGNYPKESVGKTICMNTYVG